MGIQWPQTSHWGGATSFPIAHQPRLPAYFQAGDPRVAYTQLWQRPPVLLSTFTSPNGYPISLYTLSNGHRVLIEQRPTDVISLRTFVNAGSINENPYYNSALYGKTGLPTGIAHL